MIYFWYGAKITIWAVYVLFRGRSLESSSMAKVG